MLTKVQKWGNSQGLRVSREILEQAQINVGDPIAVTARRGEIVIKAARKVRGRYTLKQLLARMPKGYKVQEVNWGPPVGKEVW